MTVKDFLGVLINDNKTTISIQTKNDIGIMTEVANDSRMFDSSLERHYDDVIQLVKIEKKKIFIII